MMEHPNLPAPPEIDWDQYEYAGEYQIGDVRVTVEEETTWSNDEYSTSGWTVHVVAETLMDDLEYFDAGHNDWRGPDRLDVLRLLEENGLYTRTVEEHRAYVGRELLLAKTRKYTAIKTAEANAKLIREYEELLTTLGETSLTDQLRVTFGLDT